MDNIIMMGLIKKANFYSCFVLFLTLILSSNAYAQGSAVPWQLNLQEAGSPVMERITDFHTMLLWLIGVIVVFVTLLLAYVVIRFNAKANPVPSKTTHHVMLEVIWTLVPVLILVAVVVPSMKLLYYADRTVDAEMTIKVTGYQWHWGYDYPDHGGISFKSYMIPDEEIKPGQKRLLETDNQVVVPIQTNIRLLITADDVLHSWAMPSLGVKLDAVPGRLNETWMRVEKEGIYYGQCSEICGTNHAFMPITIRAVSKEDFDKWVIEAKEEFSELETINNIQIAYAGVK